jgi:hypothetical protein
MLDIRSGRPATWKPLAADLVAGAVTVAMIVLPIVTFIRR